MSYFEAKLLMVGAVKRWAEAGSGAFSQSTAGPFSTSIDTIQRASGWRLGNTEEADLRELCNDSNHERAFSFTGRRRATEKTPPSGSCCAAPTIYRVETVGAQCDGPGGAPRWALSSRCFTSRRTPSNEPSNFHHSQRSSRLVTSCLATESTQLSPFHNAEAPIVRVRRPDDRPRERDHPGRVPPHHRQGPLTMPYLRRTDRLRIAVAEPSVVLARSRHPDSSRRC